MAGAVTRGAHRWVPRCLARLEQSGELGAAIAATRVSDDALIAEVEVNPFFADRVSRAGELDAAVASVGAEASGKGVVVDADELAARAADDRRDADAFRLLFYTGLRIGEVLTLRWEDVDIDGRMLLVRRGLSSGVESTPKGRRHRFVPLSTRQRKHSRVSGQGVSSPGLTTMCSVAGWAGVSIRPRCAAGTRQAVPPRGYGPYVCMGFVTRSGV